MRYIELGYVLGSTALYALIRHRHRRAARQAGADPQGDTCTDAQP